MKSRILVTYATRCGSTREVAHVLAAELKADLRPISQVNNLSPYHAVIVGSAIRVGKWLPEATNFVQEHQAELRNKYTAYFTLCMTLQEDTAAHRQEVRGYLDPILKIHQPDALEFFPGKVDYQNMSFFLRLMVKNLIRIPEGDFRNWEAIRAWAKTLQPHLARVA